MFPFLLALPPVAAAATDITMYVGGAALFGTGGLIGYLLHQPEVVPQESTHHSRGETSHLNSAKMLQSKTRKTRKRVLENLGEEAIEGLERVLEEAHKARLKLGALIADFSEKTLEMEKTTQTLKALIDTLSQGNKTATETITHLSSEIESLKAVLLKTRKKFGKTISGFLKRAQALETIIQNFEHLKADLEGTQRAYHDQIVYLTEALENANKQLNLQVTHQASQEAHIQTLQEKVEKLTQCLQVVTAKG